MSSIDAGKQHAVLVRAAEAETLGGDQRRELADVPALLVPITPIIGTTIGDFRLDSVGWWFHIVEKIPGYRNHFF